MDDIIIISNLNDFIFCPASIYFHKLYGSEDVLMYQSSYQIDGTKAHELGIWKSGALMITRNTKLICQSRIRK